MPDVLGSKDGAVMSINWEKISLLAFFVFCYLMTVLIAIGIGIMAVSLAIIAVATVFYGSMFYSVAFDKF